MIQSEAKSLADEIYQDVVAAGICSEKVSRIKAAVLIAKSIQKHSTDAVWQYVINNLNSRKP